MALTTITAVVFIVVLLAELFGLHTNPYVGILFFLVLPALFVLGLLLIPFGAWIERRRRAAGKPAAVAGVAAHRPQRSETPPGGVSSSSV